LPYVGPKSGILQQCVQAGLSPEVDYRVAVLEALHSVLNGHLTIAEVFVGLGKVGENPWVPRSQCQGGLGVGDCFFAKMVLRKEHAEHRLRPRIGGIDCGVLPEKSDDLCPGTKRVFVILEPVIGGLEVGPNTPILVVEFQRQDRDPSKISGGRLRRARQNPRQSEGSV